MNLLSTINLLLQLAVQYLTLRIKTSTLDILDKFDARIDKLDAQREKFRKSTNMLDQERADKIMNEILEEKKKLSIWKQELDGQTKVDIVKP